MTGVRDQNLQETVVSDNPYNPTMSPLQMLRLAMLMKKNMHTLRSINANIYHALKPHKMMLMLINLSTMLIQESSRTSRLSNPGQQEALYVIEKALTHLLNDITEFNQKLPQIKQGNEAIEAAKLADKFLESIDRLSYCTSHFPAPNTIDTQIHGWAASYFTEALKDEAKEFLTAAKEGAQKQIGLLKFNHGFYSLIDDARKEINNNSKLDDVSKKDAIERLRDIKNHHGALLKKVYADQVSDLSYFMDEFRDFLPSEINNQFIKLMKNAPEHLYPFYKSSEDIAEENIALDLRLNESLAEIKDKMVENLKSELEKLESDKKKEEGTISRLTEDIKKPQAELKKLKLPSEELGALRGKKQEIEDILKHIQTKKEEFSKRKDKKHEINKLKEQSKTLSESLKEINKNIQIWENTSQKELQEKIQKKLQFEKELSLFAAGIHTAQQKILELEPMIKQKEQEIKDLTDVKVDSTLEAWVKRRAGQGKAFLQDKLHLNVGPQNAKDFSEQINQHLSYFRLRALVKDMYLILEKQQDTPEYKKDEVDKLRNEVEKLKGLLGQFLQANVTEEAKTKFAKQFMDTYISLIKLNGYRHYTVFGAHDHQMARFIQETHLTKEFGPLHLVMKARTYQGGKHPVTFAAYIHAAEALKEASKSGEHKISESQIQKIVDEAVKHGASRRSGNQNNFQLFTSQGHDFLLRRKIERNVRRAITNDPHLTLESQPTKRAQPTPQA